MGWTTFDSSGASVSRSLSDTPIGTVQPYAGTAAPNGWLFCDGSSISTTAYPELFSAIGYTYGGSGTSFTVPDLRGRVPAGRDNMGGSAASRLTNTVLSASDTLGATGGAQTHALTTAQLPAHKHGVALKSDGAIASFNIQLGSSGNTYRFASDGTIGNNNGSDGSASVGSDNAHTNTQPTIVLNYIIYAQSVSARIEAVTPPQYVTTLPSAPVNGQEVYYAADATNGVIWHLRYRGTSSSSYKWEYVGGSRLTATVEGASTRASTAFGDLADSANPSITLPLAGDYEVSFGAFVRGAASQAALVQANTGAPANDDLSTLSYSDNSTSAGSGISRTLILTGRSASATLKLYFRSGGGTMNVERRWIATRPVRVG